MSNTRKKSEKSVFQLVRAAIQSPLDKVAAILVGIYEALVVAGVKTEEFATLNGDAGAEKRRVIAEFIRNTIRGVKYDLSSAAIGLAKKLGVIEGVMDISVPEGGKVFRMKVLVDWTQAWREYLLAQCPQKDTGRDILKVGDQYPSPKQGATIEEIYLVWFGLKVGVKAEQADTWAVKNHFVRSHGRIPSAVIGGVPNILAQLKKLGYCYDSVGIISTSSCDLGEVSYLPYAWQVDGGERRAGLCGASIDWSDHNLFAFFRKTSA